MPTVGLAVPVIRMLGLCAGAEATVQHHDQWCPVGQSRRSVHVEGPANPAHLDRLRGLTHRDRLGTRHSQRMTAAKAATEEDNQGSDEKHGEYPNASRPHEPIVAGAPIFDK
jgi:hypothetical protein